MPISLDPLPLSPVATAKRPLAGMTVLLVEDSRYASEAVRLLCLKSGARIRRADRLRAAKRHLACYVPTVAIVDIGLPDGSGIELVRELDAAHPRIPAILATSGDDRSFVEAVDAGADGTILKPINSLATFQQVVLDAMPGDIRPEGLRLVDGEMVDPDPIALTDDLTHIADVLTVAEDDRTYDYVTQFLTGLARTARDSALEEAACSLADRRSEGAPVTAELARLAGIIQNRIERKRAI